VRDHEAGAQTKDDRKPEPPPRKSKFGHVRIARKDPVEQTERTQRDEHGGDIDTRVKAFQQLRKCGIVTCANGEDSDDRCDDSEPGQCNRSDGQLGGKSRGRRKIGDADNGKCGRRPERDRGEN
jgi:hypothetical protein